MVVFLQSTMTKELEYALRELRTLAQHNNNRKKTQKNFTKFAKFAIWETLKSA